MRLQFKNQKFQADAAKASQKMNLFELFKQKCQWDDAEVRNNVKVI